MLEEDKVSFSNVALHSWHICFGKSEAETGRREPGGWMVNQSEPSALRVTQINAVRGREEEAEERRDQVIDEGRKRCSPDGNPMERRDGKRQEEKAVFPTGSSRCSCVEA